MILYIAFNDSTYRSTSKYKNSKELCFERENPPPLRAWISGQLLRKLVPGAGWSVKRSSSWEGS